MSGLLARSAAAAALLLTAATACTDATDVRLLEISATGSLVGQVYVDLNRSGSVEPTDRPLPYADITLSTPTTDLVVATTTTNDNGIFVFAEVPTGTYRLRVDEAALGDSLTTLTTLPLVDVSLGDTLSAVIGVSYPQLTIEELRTAAPGRRVFTTGIALNVRDNPADGRVFLEGATAFLQTVEVPRQPNVAVGDSLRLLGRTILRDGQPMLQGDSVPTVILINRAKVPSPRVTTTGTGATANGGPLDAALVRVNLAEISDTATVGDAFHFTADDGSGPLRVVVRPFLQRNNSDIRPDTIIRVDHAIGMLSPHDDGSGTVRWRLLVRSAGELVTELRRADVSVTAAFDPGTASEGETVELTVVVANAGPLAATGVEVADTLHTSLSRQSSTTSQSSYASSGIAGLWTIPRIEPGRADTLRVTVEVTGAATGPAPYIARAGGLDREVDPVGDNNRATASLTLTAP